MIENIEKNYKSAKDTLFNLTSNEDSLKNWIKDRLENKELNAIEEMKFHLKRLDVDISKLSFIHVAGTKGKGSTCAFTESILREKGLKTGLYTSPHLIEPRERIKINGKPISESEFSSSFWRVYEKLQTTNCEGTNYPQVPPFFRFLTLMAFDVFAKEQIDVCIMEVGLGGRCDATNVVNPICCGITSIGYDHMNVLGNTLEEIGREKAGIIKPYVPCFSFRQQKESIEQVFQNFSHSKNSFLHFVDEKPLLSFPLGIEGLHQYSNATLAIYLSQYWYSLYLSRLSSPNNISNNNNNNNNTIENKSNTNNTNTNNNNNDVENKIENFDLDSFLLNRNFYQNNLVLDNQSKEQILSFDEKITNEIKLNVMNTLNDQSPLLKSLQKCKWRGRGQRVDWEIEKGKEEKMRVKLILDGAHTKESVTAFGEWISSFDKIGEQNNVLIFNCNQSKNLESLLTQLISVDPILKFKVIIFTTNDHFENQNDPHSVHPTQSISPIQINWQEKMMELWKSNNQSHANQTIFVSRSLKESFEFVHTYFTQQHPSSSTPNLFITGSLYLVGSVLKYIKFDVDDL